jgi:hypothetical protein
LCRTERLCGKVSATAETAEVARQPPQGGHLPQQGCAPKLARTQGSLSLPHHGRTPRHARCHRRHASVNMKKKSSHYLKHQHPTRHAHCLARTNVLAPDAYEHAAASPCAAECMALQRPRALNAAFTQVYSKLSRPHRTCTALHRGTHNHMA